MHVPGEAGTAPGTGHAVAIVGAALRFPGASDPSSFFELTVAGRRMFRDRAALLDDGSGPPGRDDELPRGITARHALAAETAADALADVPDAGRAVAPDRIGVFIADIPEP